MRRTVFLSFVAALGLGALAAAPPSAADELTRLLNEQAAAWSRGDLDAFCAVYADDATFVSPSGLTNGRKEVLERYRKKYVDKAGMGSLRLEIVETRVLGGPDAMSAVARWSLTWPEKPKAEGLTLLVFKKTAAGWRILQDASM
jgi:uncharacterized protein (TIGR02246 family)